MREWLTSGDVVKLIGSVSLSTVQRWTAQGILPAIRLPGKRGDRRYYTEDVLRFLARLRHPQAEDSHPE
jgi:DNA-binding transcriptional MerR regulator